MPALGAAVEPVFGTDSLQLVSLIGYVLVGPLDLPAAPAPVRGARERCSGVDLHRASVAALLVCAATDRQLRGRSGGARPARGRARPRPGASLAAVVARRPCSRSASPVTRRSCSWAAAAWVAVTQRSRRARCAARDRCGRRAACAAAVRRSAAAVAGARRESASRCRTTRAGASSRSEYPGALWRVAGDGLRHAHAQHAADRRAGRRRTRGAVCAATRARPVLQPRPRAPPSRARR